MHAHARSGRAVLGICGGFQMLCRRIDDTVESPQRRGSRTRPARCRHRVRRREGAAALGRPAGAATRSTTAGSPAAPRPAGSRRTAHPQGFARGAVYGTHWHGLLDNDDFRRGWLRRRRRGRRPARIPRRRRRQRAGAPRRPTRRHGRSAGGSPRPGRRSGPAGRRAAGAPDRHLGAASVALPPWRVGVGSLLRWRRRFCWSPVAGARSRAARHGRVPPWRGSLLSAADLPPGVQFDRIVERPGLPDGAGAPPSMLSRPEGCANALTNVIAESAERGPGSAAKYSVGYDGARIVMTVLSWRLDLGKLEAAASPLRELRGVLRRSRPGHSDHHHRAGRCRKGCPGLPADDAVKRFAQ